MLFGEIHALQVSYLTTHDTTDIQDQAHPVNYLSIYLSLDSSPCANHKRMKDFALPHCPAALYIKSHSLSSLPFLHHLHPN